jgi:hypothetical protein
MTSVTIMQPCCLPYYGYFELIKETDIFIFLDNVQFSKGSYQQRNKVSINGKDTWLTIPVKQKLGQLIHDVEVADENGVRRIIDIADRYFGVKLYSAPGGKLIDKTLSWIFQLCEIQRIKFDFRMASKLGENDIVDICKMLEADTYISTAGSKSYLTPDSEYAKRFDDAGIDVQFREFKPDYSIIQYINKKENNDGLEK